MLDALHRLYLAGGCTRLKVSDGYVDDLWGVYCAGKSRLAEFPMTSDEIKERVRHFKLSMSQYLERDSSLLAHPGFTNLVLRYQAEFLAEVAFQLAVMNEENEH